MLVKTLTLVLVVKCVVIWAFCIRFYFFGRLSVIHITVRDCFFEDLVSTSVRVDILYTSLLHVRKLFYEVDDIFAIIILILNEETEA